MSDNTTKDKLPHNGLHPPYAAVCFFPRPDGRPDNRNCLESGEIRGNMLTRQTLWSIRPYIGRMAKNFRLILEFLHCIYAFRSILYAFRSPHPKITENLPIN